MMPACYHLDMRTTITLDEDVAAKVREDMQLTGRTFKDTVNENLRLGFIAKAEPKPKKFVVKAKDMGRGIINDFTSASELIEFLEGPMHR
jgi:hypothetical protein